MAELRVASSELILGGQKSGKTRRAELLAAVWLARAESHRAVYIATAQSWDDEMRERIERHRQDRAVRVPRMATVEEPFELAQAIARHSRADTLIVVDCLTLWLTARLMPAAAAGASAQAAPAPDLIDGNLIRESVQACAGPIVLIRVSSPTCAAAEVSRWTKTSGPSPGTSSLTKETMTWSMPGSAARSGACAVREPAFEICV